MNITCIASAPLQSHALPEQGADEDISMMRRDGYRQYLTSSQSLFDLTAATIRECLSTADLEPAAVEAVILVTESFYSYNDCLQTDSQGSSWSLRDGLVAAIAAELPKAFNYGNWLSGCANLAPSLALARALLASGQHGNIMLLFVDRLRKGGDRVVGSTLFSDVGVACVVGRGQGWEIQHVLTRMSSSLMQARREKNIILQGKHMMSELGSLAAAFRQQTGRNPNDVQLIVADNLHSAFLEMAAEGLGVPKGRLRSISKASVAHSFSADCLLSLRQSLLEHTHTGETLLVNLSPWSLGLVLLKWQAGRRYESLASVRAE